MRAHATARTRGACGAAVLVLALLVAARPARATGVNTALALASVAVEPDSSFDLELDVTQAGSAFNSFTAVITYDPAALTFLPRSPLTLQQGCLMTGTCSGACGTTFHQFTAAADSLVIQESLLCDNYSLTGPGQVYKLRFRAAHAEQTTYVRVRRIQFYNGGVKVTPVTSSDARVDIHRTLGVAPGVTAGGLRLGVVPNPARGALALSIESGEAGEQSVDVLDLAGRLVTRLDHAWYAPGARVVRWDGAGTDGARLPSGVYLVRMRAGGHLAQSRVVLLH